MKVGVRTDDAGKMEMLSQGINDDLRVEWVSDWKDLSLYDACIDLLFDPEIGDKDQFENAGNAILILNSVCYTLDALPRNAVRINGWRTFLQRPVVEASCLLESDRVKTEHLFSLFNKKVEWTTDDPGFIAGKVVSMIINEAYFALQEKVSSRDEIDMAMKLGTNYPYGPFEWSKRIGLRTITDLLTILERSSDRYAPCPLLLSEAFQS